MAIDVLLACAGALVAIYGIAHDLAPSTQKGLIALAVVIAVATMVKAYSDDRDKTLMKTAVTGTLDPTPAAITKIYRPIIEAARKRGYENIDWIREDTGVVIYLGRPGRPDEAIALDRMDIAELYAQVIIGGEPGEPERIVRVHVPFFGYPLPEDAIVARLLGQKFPKEAFDETGYSEELNGRLCILASGSVRQVLRRKVVDCDWDSTIGVTVSFEARQKTDAIVIPASEISTRFRADGVNARVLFAELDKRIRDEVRKRTATP